MIHNRYNDITRNITRAYNSSNLSVIHRLSKNHYYCHIHFSKMDSLQNLINNCELLWSVEKERHIISLLKIWTCGARKQKSAYRLHDKYIVKTFGGLDKVVTKNSDKVVATRETALAIIEDIHISCGHKGFRKTYDKVKENYCNITRAIVSEFIRQCERCAEKLKKKEKTGLVVKPIVSSDYNHRVQIDLVDYQSLSDGDYRFIFHYQDHLTKYHILRPLRSKTAVEVAHHLFGIFIDFGAPQILQSDNGREFTANVIKVFFILFLFYFYFIYNSYKLLGNFPTLARIETC